MSGLSRWRQPRGAAFLLAVLLIAGCTNGEETDDALDEETPVEGTSAAATVTSPGADDVNRLLDSESHLVETFQAPILAVDTPSEHQLIVAFEMGSHHCFGVVTDVSESDAEVVVDLRIGRRSAVEPTDCIAGVYPYTTAITLAAPLGDRTIVAAEIPEPDPEPDPDVEPEPGAGPDAESEPSESASATGSAEVEAFIGRPIEDGVEWALSSGLRWRVLSFDGEPVDNGSDDDSDGGRVSFIVVRDRITAYQWS